MCACAIHKTINLFEVYIPLRNFVKANRWEAAFSYFQLLTYASCGRAQARKISDVLWEKQRPALF